MADKADVTDTVTAAATTTDFMDHAVRALLSGILLRANSDAKENQGAVMLRKFVKSPWCDNICLGLGIDYFSYRDKILAILDDHADRLFMQREAMREEMMR